MTNIANYVAVNPLTGGTGSATPSGSAGGALSGTYPNPTIAPGTSAQILMSNATPATTWTTMSQDGTLSATGVLTINSISGASPFAVTPATVAWVKGAAAPLLTQTAPTTDVATQAMTVHAQDGYSGAVTNKVGGNLNLQSGVGIGTNAYNGGGATSTISIQIAGANTVAQFGNNVNSTGGDSLYFPNAFTLRANSSLSLASSSTLTLRAFGGSQPVAITSDTGAVQIQSNSVNLVQYDGYGEIYTSTTRSVATTGTVALTAAQQGATYIILSGSMTGNVTVQFTATVASNTVRKWIIDISGVTFSAHTLTFGIGTNSTTAAVTALVTNSNILTLYAPTSNTCFLNL